MEMHDAMQVHWSRFANVAQWSVWTLLAGQHEPVPSQDITPQNLGGIMFDDIGPNHRQGTAVFNGSFIDAPPPDDPNAAAVRRIKFWTAVHELGHTFNLAHSRSLRARGRWPGRPLAAGRSGLWLGRFCHGGKGPDDADGSEAVVLDLAFQRTPVYSR
jgi:hypothetical protein